MGKYRIASKDGNDLLCKYKANPSDTLPIVGFMGKFAALLASDNIDKHDGPHGPVIVEYQTQGAAQCAASIYGGTVEHVPTLNGGW